MNAESDPLLRDIQRAVKDGYFDNYQPSELSLTSVEELLGRVALMSDAGRREYLTSISGQGRRGTGPARPPRVVGLPADDELRFGEDGQRLSKEELDAKLEGIIDSWDTWHHYSPPAPERARGWLSSPRDRKGERREGRWLSRGDD